MVTTRLFTMAGFVCLAAFGAASQPPATAPVAVSLRTDKKAYHPKDPVKLTFTVKNPSKLPAKLNYSSGMKYDFEIRKGKTPVGEKVWQWAHGRMFAQMILQTTLEPGKQLVFTETFTPGEKDPLGKPTPCLEPGTYTATAVLALMGRAPRPMAQTTFTVK